jgi:NADH-quinone oxidoreductase chain G
MLKVTINGIEIELERPVTVLEAAKKAGIKIPTLCHFEGLPPFGGCRLCLVEVEKLPKLQTACTLMTTDGMVVRTETAQIKAARRAMLEFLLINHPLDCPYCDKAGECELQDLVAIYGPEAGRFAEGKRTHPESFDDPIIVRNMERCVLCTRCVRMCDELQGAFAITVTGRGSHSFVEPFTGGKYNCEYCGNCLTVCPVGAIMSRLHRHSYRPWYVEREVQTTCGYCGVGCTMILQMREERIIRSIPRIGLGLNKGLLCVRGRFGYDFVESTERLSTPLINKNGQLQPASWQEAYEYIVNRLKEIKEKYGADAIGGIASGRCTNEDNYMLQRFMRFVIGTNNIDSLARLSYAPTVSYLESIFGQGITANLIPGIANSDGALVVGGDPTTINPILGLQIRAIRKNAGKVVVIGPPGGLKRFVTNTLITDTDSEEMVLSAILGRLSEEKELRGELPNLEEKIRAVKVPSQDELSDASIEVNEIKAAVDTLMGMENPVVIIGPEVSMQRRASKRLFLIAAIAYLINARLFVLSERPNLQGLMDMGCEPHMLPGGRPLEFEMFRHKMEESLGKKVPERKGMNLFEMLDAAQDGQLKALYVMGENLIQSLPNREKVERALKSLELLIVQDIYLTETSRLADVVLPASSWSEKDGTFTNLERRIQSVRAARTVSPGRADWRIIADISSHMGDSGDFSSVESVWEEIIHISPLHAGLSYEDIAKGNALWPYHGEPLRGVEGEFDVEEIGTLPEKRAKDTFNMQLHRPLYHSGSTSRHSKALLSIVGEPLLMINPSSAEKLSLKDGDKVVISSDIYRAEAKIKISDDVRTGEVALCNTFSGLNFMQFVDYEVSPVLGCIVITKNEINVEKVT